MPDILAPVESLLPGEYLALALLRLRPMHGYEMLHIAQDEGFTEVVPFDRGVLYAYLRKLERLGLVRWQEVRAGARPPRKEYHLTAEGEALAEHWLRTPVERMRDVRQEFLLKLRLLDEIDPAEAEALLDAQIAACRRYLAAVERRAPAGRFGSLLRESRRSAALATLDWLERLRSARKGGA